MSSDKKQQRLAYLKSKPNRDNAAQGNHIRRLRFALPIIAVIMTIATVIWTFTAENSITSDIAGATLKAIAKNELVNPRFDSTDSKGQPYTITADQALRGEQDEDIILLTNPAADITLTSGRWIAIKSSNGTFDQDKNTLDLENNIRIYDDQGYTMQTEQMNIDIKTETLMSNTDINGQGPAGKIVAKGMKSNLKQGLLSFHGPATLTLNNTGNSSILGGLKQ